MSDAALENISLNSQYQQGSFRSTSSLSISLSSSQARVSFSLIIRLILYKLVVKVIILGWTKFQQNPTALIQQILTGGRSIGFFTDFYQAGFYSIGFIVFFSLYSIFYKLFFRSISSIYCLIFLAFYYSCVGPRSSTRDLGRLLPAS